MFGKIKKISVILAAACIWSLCSGSGTSGSHDFEGEDKEEHSFLYEDGDVVGFIGDSITHVEYLPVSYVELLENYYLTHYPEREIEFRNLGMAGYMVRDILEIYDRDPAFRGINKAVIMLGMNEAMQKIPAEEYLANLEALIGRLKADGLSGEDILILSPTPYDQTCGINYDRNGFPYQTTDTRLQEFVAELSGKTASWGVRYVDLHTPMRELSLEIQKENDRNTLTVGDCIHPDLIGHWIMVYEILKVQGADFSGNPAPVYYDLYINEGRQYEGWKPDTFPAKVAEQIAEKNQERHLNSAVYRAAICAVRAENPDFSEEQLEEPYEHWRAEDVRIREEIHACVQEIVCAAEEERKAEEERLESWAREWFLRGRPKMGFV